MEVLFIRIMTGISERVVGRGRVVGCERVAGYMSGRWLGEQNGYAMVFLRGACTRLVAGLETRWRGEVLLYQQFYALCFVGGQIGLVEDRVFFCSCVWGNLVIIGQASKADACSIAIRDQLDQITFSPGTLPILTFKWASR